VGFEALARRCVRPSVRPRDELILSRAATRHGRNGKRSLA
jgi:hypothetical protein